jgi:hypothetical protein
MRGSGEIQRVERNREVDESQDAVEVDVIHGVKSRMQAAKEGRDVVGR